MGLSVEQMLLLLEIIIMICVFCVHISIAVGSASSAAGKPPSETPPRRAAGEIVRAPHGHKGWRVGGGHRRDVTLA